jgi:hypothetical protein
LFVKELAAVRFAYRVAAFAAAEKRDYEEQSAFRQQVFLLPFAAPFAPPTTPANPASLVPPALQRGSGVARGRILRGSSQLGNSFVTQV